MNNDNYITVQGWMVNELHLSGNELLVYALIYGFSQDRESRYSGSMNYIAESIGVSRRNTFDIIGRLLNKDLIIKTEIYRNGVKYCEYAAKVTPYDEKSQFAMMKGHGGDDERSHNNNIDKNKDIYKEEIVKEEYDLSFVSDEFRPAVNKWLEYKKERRERYKSTSSVKVFYNNLLKYSGNNPAKALEVVDQSIGNNYSGIFELKTKNASSFNGTTPTNGRASSRVPVGKKRVYTSTI